MQPSLPRRLRFNRHNSDLTPKKSKNAHAAASAAIAATTTLSAKSPPITKEKTDKDELDAAKVELINKTEVLLEYEQLIDELKQKTHLLSQLNDEHTDAHNAKDVRIRELEKEVFDSHMANEMLEAISEKAITKINVLEGEIRMILRNHDNEIEFLIRTNAELEMRYEQMAAQERSSNVKHELAAIKIELNDYKSKFEACEQMLQEERAKMLEKDNECNKLLDENLSLVEQLDALKKQADDDMLTYALETHKLSSDLEIEKREKTKIITELCLKEEFLMEIQRELAAKEAEMDAERDELKASYNAEVETVSKKFDQHVSNLKEVHEMQLKEAESIYAAEMAKLSLDHNAAMIKLKEISQKEIDRINDMAEEKIRISEIQAEQKLKGLEVALEQTIQKEKESWKIEIEKCQKIAENEIMQCEFEKQDLKTLLQSANDLMHQKDDKIEELEQRLQKESDTVTRGNGMLESELKKCQRELYNYHLTLNNTRATVNILMERLRKSDKDVEVLQMELDSMLEVKASMETQNLELSEEANNLRNEVNEYRNALSALRNSSLVLERQIVEKESAFEKLLSSEEETLETVNKMGQLFNEKLEQNIDKYAELYNDLKRKYDARETYIKDMKALLEEFATGIELARFELDLKEKQIFELLEENKNIKLETMTYKFKCEQFEKYDFEQRVPNPSPDFTLEEDNGKVSTTDDAMVSNQLIENIINQLEKEANNQTPSNVHNTELYSDEDKITAENMQLREKVSEQMKQIEILKEMADMESCHAKENLELKSKVRAEFSSVYSVIVNSYEFFLHSVARNGTKSGCRQAIC